MKIELTVEEFKQVVGGGDTLMYPPYLGERDLKVPPIRDGGIHKVDTKTTTYTDKLDPDDAIKRAGPYLDF